MTTSGLPALCAALLLLPSGGLAETLHSQGLVRRESVGVTEVAQISRNDKEGGKEAPELGCTGCDTKDFVIGTERKNSCRWNNESLVSDFAMCKYAADRTGAHKEPDHIMRIDSTENPTWARLHPAGCFHVKCTPHGQADTSVAAMQDCYFFNNADGSQSDDSETTFAGTPVCKREMFEDGATNGQEGCPSEYQLIRNESLCFEQCSIKNEVCAHWFQVGVFNFSEHWDYPEGCFYIRAPVNDSHTQDQVFFNNLSTRGTAPVTGTVICDVIHPMHWTYNAPTVDSGHSHVNTTLASEQHAARLAAAAATTPAPGR